MRGVSMNNFVVVTKVGLLKRISNASEYSDIARTFEFRSKLRINISREMSTPGRINNSIDLIIIYLNNLNV